MYKLKLKNQIFKERHYNAKRCGNAFPHQNEVWERRSHAFPPHDVAVCSSSLHFTKTKQKILLIDIFPLTCRGYSVQKHFLFSSFWTNRVSVELCCSWDNFAWIVLQPWGMESHRRTEALHCVVTSSDGEIVLLHIYGCLNRLLAAAERVYCGHNWTQWLEQRQGAVKESKEIGM